MSLASPGQRQKLFSHTGQHHSQTESSPPRYQPKVGPILATHINSIGAFDLLLSHHNKSLISPIVDNNHQSPDISTEHHENLSPKLSHQYISPKSRQNMTNPLNLSHDLQTDLGNIIHTAQNIYQITRISDISAEVDRPNSGISNGPRILIRPIERKKNAFFGIRESNLERDLSIERKKLRFNSAIERSGEFSSTKPTRLKEHKVDLEILDSVQRALFNQSPRANTENDLDKSKLALGGKSVNIIEYKRNGSIDAKMKSNLLPPINPGSPSNKVAQYSQFMEFCNIEKLDRAVQQQTSRERNSKSPSPLRANLQALEELERKQKIMQYKMNIVKFNEMHRKALRLVNLSPVQSSKTDHTLKNKLLEKIKSSKLNNAETLQNYNLYKPTPPPFSKDSTVETKESQKDKSMFKENPVPKETNDLKKPKVKFDVDSTRKIMEENLNKNFLLKIPAKRLMTDPIRTDSSRRIEYSMPESARRTSRNNESQIIRSSFISGQEIATRKYAYKRAQDKNILVDAQFNTLDKRASTFEDDDNKDRELVEGFRRYLRLGV